MAAVWAGSTFTSSRQPFSGDTKSGPPTLDLPPSHTNSALATNLRLTRRGASKWCPRADVGKLPSIHRNLPIHHDQLEPLRILMRRRERRLILDPSRIEHHEVRRRSLPHQPAIAQAEGPRGQRRHPLDRILERQHAARPHILREHPRVGPIRPRMRIAYAHLRHTAVARNRGVRISHDALDIEVTPQPVNHACAAGDQYVEYRLDR